MSLTLCPIHPGFVAVASGVDLAKPLTAQEVAEIDAAMDRFGVLIFRDQPLQAEEQLAFAKNFGPLDLGLRKVSKSANRLEHVELLDISNVDESGKVADRNHRKIVGNIANQLWHSDSSFQYPAARYSMLSAVVLPSAGGQTEFCDLRAAYDDLPEDLKQEVEELEVEHYALHSRFMLGDDQYTEEQRNALPPVIWPLVRTHRSSGRKLLFIGAHASRIPSMTLAEGRMMLADLLEHATRRERIYSHEWQVGDLVMWDNRSTLHRGRRYDLSVRRELRRTTTLDIDNSDPQVAAA
jgi:alpha-ketoglutarate-dependent 2,4-dichlorophenoxyacetate dioxygenase